MSSNGKTRTESQNEKNHGITAISVEGFRSLVEESRIEIRPLTILAGANSSGKSSILQPLLLMKQTLEANHDSEPLLLIGPHAKYTSFQQFMSRRSGISEIQSFSIATEIADEFRHKISFALTADRSLEITEMNVEHRKAGSIELMPNQSGDGLKKRILEFFRIETDWPELPEGYQWTVDRKRCFLGFTAKAPDEIGNFIEANANEAMMFSSFFSGLFYLPIEREISRMIHVPGLRGNPERVYYKTATGPDFTGTFETYIATLIEQWQERNREKLQELDSLLRVLRLTGEISAKNINDAQIELRVGRLLKSKRSETDLVSIADVGFGVSQALPVLVALLVADAGRVVYLEQPELHLHPRAQFSLASILADTAKRGVKLIAETHSALLLRSVQTLVAKGDLDPDLVILHWFLRNDDGSTTIHSADLDENGAFGDWPEDFGDVEMTAESAYLDAVEERIKN